jgi:hypothetical protein
LSHAYARAGKYTVTVGVMDPFGVVGRQTLTALVTPPPAPPASGFGAALDAFVTTLYLEDLGRLPEPSGLRFWSGLLAAGVKPQTVALAIWGAAARFAILN